MDQQQLFYQYDPPSAALTYGRFLQQTRLRDFVTTVGSSTTVTTQNATSNAFDIITVGDHLWVWTNEAPGTIDGFPTVDKRQVTVVTNPNQVTINAVASWNNEAPGTIDGFPTVDKRQVTVVTNPNQVTINAVASWNNAGLGFGAYLYPFRFGTGVEHGRVKTARYDKKSIKLNLDTLAGTNITYSIEGRQGGPDATWFVIFTGTLTATGPLSFTIAEEWMFLRVGLQRSGAAGNSVSVYFVGDIGRI